MNGSILGQWLSCNHSRRQYGTARGASKASLPASASAFKQQRARRGIQAIDKWVCRVQRGDAANSSRAPFLSRWVFERQVIASVVFVSHVWPPGIRVSLRMPRGTRGKTKTGAIERGEFYLWLFYWGGDERKYGAPKGKSSSQKCK